jgi:phospholipase C
MGDTKLDRFDHLVVVMFENRSFDNVLGYLYDGYVPPCPTFNGVAGGKYSNPVPYYIQDGHSTVEVGPSPLTEAAFSNPNPDPGEEYQHVNTQLFNIVNPKEYAPEGNEFALAKDMKSPWNAPASG